MIKIENVRCEYLINPIGIDVEEPRITRCLSADDFNSNGLYQKSFQIYFSINRFDNILDNLQKTYDSVSYDDLDFIVDKIHEANNVCFAGNFFTQSVSMQLQIELSYLGKECSGMYPLEQQVVIIESLDENDVIIVSSIAGGFMIDHPDVMRVISKSPAYKIVILEFC